VFVTWLVITIVFARSVSRFYDWTATDTLSCSVINTGKVKIWPMTTPKLIHQIVTEICYTYLPQSKILSWSNHCFSPYWWFVILCFLGYFSHTYPVFTQPWYWLCLRQAIGSRGRHNFTMFFHFARIGLLNRFRWNFGSNHPPTDEMITFWAERTRDKGAGYDRK